MSSVENEGESECSSTSSRPEEISNSEYLTKFQKKNINIRNFKILLVNGLSKIKKEADFTPEPKKEDEFSAVSDSALVDNDEAFLSSDGNQFSDFGSTGFEFEEKASVDENSFELRIDNDDDDVNSAIKRRLKSDQHNENKKGDNVSDEHSLLPNVGSSAKVRFRSYLSTDLENISIPDTINNDNTNKKKRLTAATPIILSTETSSSPVTQSSETEFNCAFCEKKWPSRHSLKFHVLSHLKSFLKQDGRDNLLASTSESENGAAEDADGSASSDFMCVFCEKSFTNKMTLRTHYRVDHQAGTHKGSPQSQYQSRSSVSSTLAAQGVRWQSSENKIDIAVAAGQSITTSATNESSTSLNADENGDNDDASKQYKCYICDKQFARNSSLMWHIQFHETYMYSKLKKNNSELENGLSPAGGTGIESFPVDADHSFRCQVCAKTYESLSGYRRHMANHGSVDEEAGSGEKCELCNKFFPTAIGLKRHIIFMHKDQLPPTPLEDMEDAVEDCFDSISGSSVSDEYICDICGRPFTHRNSYKRHMNSMHKMKHCEKTTPPNLVEEEDTSKDAGGEFVCDICHRSFCSQRAVNIHRAHGHRTELSDSVASDTVASDTLASDMIPCDSYIETEEGNFQCTVCDKIFESRKGVVRHIGYHRSALNAQMAVNNTDAESAADDNDDYENDDDDEADEEEMENSIPCLVCGKTFASIRGMRIHANSHREMASNEGENDDDDDSNSGFDCDICNETFKGYRSFKIHMSWHRRRGEEAAVIQKKSAKTSLIPRPPQSGLGKIHQCRHCPRWYTTQQALAGHMKVHQHEKGIAPSQVDQSQPVGSGGKTSQSSMCKVCGQYFPNSTILNSHMKLHMEDGIATPTTSSGQPLTLEDTMECDMCGKFFMRKQDMAKHMRDHMGGTVTKENVDLSMFRCIYCEKSFVGRKSLNTHQVLHEEAQAALKRAADEMLVGAPPAKQHRPNDSASAAQEDLFGWDDVMPAHQCEECDRRLSTKQSLRRHMEWHARMKSINGVAPLKERNLMPVAPLSSLPPSNEFVGTPFECFYCRISFRTKELLVEHTKIHENIPTEGPPNVVVNDLEALGEHAVVQCVEGGNEEYFVFEQREGESYQCSECDETHFDKLQMIVHMAHHVGQRWAGGRERSLIIKMDPVMLAPFQCIFCVERFVNKKFRTRHMLQRHGEDVFQCNPCKKVFLSKKKLAVHCRQHSIDSMYRCEHCLKCFTSKWFLKRHARKKCVGKSSPERKQGSAFSMSDIEFPSTDG